MPVTLQTANHNASLWTHGSSVGRVMNDTELLHQACPDEHAKCDTMLQSSFSPTLLRTNDIYPSSNGLVYTCMNAYNHHHHLTIRPEDLWFAILSQTGFYVNANAEELRHLFVAHEGQKELWVEAVGTRTTVDFGKLAESMTMQIQKNVIDPDLRTWIIPAFSTTTQTDIVVASVLMMGAMQKYFSYGFSLSCGIPTVTLLGEREDWSEIHRRIPKLEQLGSQAERFARLLQPILRLFLETFDNPDSPEVAQFWGKIADRKSGGSGPTFLSGWITAFCFWDEDGALLADKQRHWADAFQACELDGVSYHLVDTNDIPQGFAAVPVTVDDNGDVFKAKMVAGSIGIQAKSSGRGQTDQAMDGGPGTGWNDLLQSAQQNETAQGSAHRELDSIQPLSGWWMFQLEEVKDGQPQQNTLQVDAEDAAIWQRQTLKSGVQAGA